MGFIRKVLSFVVSPTSHRTVLVLFILAAAIPLTVFISQKQQNIKQRASGQSCEADYASCTNAYNECNQSCSNLAQSDYDTYDAYTQAYSACTDKCSSDESTCNTNAYNVYLQCLSSADSNSTSSVSPTPEISQEPSPTNTPTLTPTSTPKTLFDCSETKQGSVSYRCYLDSCPSPYTYSGYNNSGTTCDVLDDANHDSVCCVNYNVSIPTPTLTPSIIPTIQSTQITYPTPTPVNPTPSPVPYCYLKNKGDGNCDNIINISDFELWRTEFVGTLKGIPIINKPSDFNSDGIINIVDFNIWKTNFQDPSLPH